MKSKMSIKEFQEYVLSEALKLYKIEVLKEEKNRIESLLNESGYSYNANEFIGKEIGHLQKDKNYKHDRAIAAAINIAKDKGYKVPEKTNESAPSAGLSAEKKSHIVKAAKAGKDIGHKGKGFQKVADKAAKEYGSKEAGEKVAAAAMWKNAH